MTAAGRSRQTVHIRNNSRLVKPHGRRRDWLQPHRLRPTRSHRPHMKIKLDSGTTTAAAERPSAPVAIRLSHSDVNRLAHWHAVRRNLGGDQLIHDLKVVRSSVVVAGRGSTKTPRMPLTVFRSYVHLKR